MKGDSRSPVTKAPRQTGKPGGFQVLCGVTDELPVNQIPGMENGKPREIHEGGVDEIIIFADPDDGGIRMESPEHRIAIALRRRKAQPFLQECAGFRLFRGEGFIQSRAAGSIAGKRIKAQNIQHKADRFSIAGAGRIVKKGAAGRIGIRGIQMPALKETAEHGGISGTGGSVGENGFIGIGEAFQLAGGGKCVQGAGIARLHKGDEFI